MRLFDHFIQSELKLVFNIPWIGIVYLFTYIWIKILLDFCGAIEYSMIKLKAIWMIEKQLRVEIIPIASFLLWLLIDQSYCMEIPYILNQK